MRRSYRRYGRRRPQYKRRYRKRTQYVTTSRSIVPVGMPNKFLTKMRYYSEFSLNPGVRPAIAVKEFRMSLYDPDVSVGGQQPTPFDQMCSFYKRFRVLGAKCIMQQLQTIDVDDEMSCIYGMVIQPATGLTAALTVQDIMQSERVTHNYKQNGIRAGNVQSDGRVRLNYSAKKFFGIVAKTDRDFTCTASADSVEYGVLSCFMASSDPTGTKDPQSQTFSCWIEFIVLCSDPNTIGTS